MTKSTKDIMKDVLGIKPEEEKVASTAPEAEQTEDIDDEFDEEETEKETPQPAPIHRRPGRPPSKPAAVQSKPPLPTPSPIVQSGSQSSSRPQPQQDSYLVWLQNNPVLSPDDVAVYKRGDGKVIVFTDALGRSILNVGIHLRKEVIDKILSDKPLAEK